MPHEQRNVSLAGNRNFWLALRDQALHEVFPLNLWKRRIWSVDISAQILPDIVRHFEEYFDDLRIELASRPEFDLLARRVKRLCGTIGPVSRDGVERVGDRKHARAQR